MNSKESTLAQKCLTAAYDGSMAFPEIIEILLSAGFEGYLVDFQADTTTYFLPERTPVVLQNPPSERNICASFDPNGIIAQIRWAQANPPDYSYATFCKHVKAHGCAGYYVSFLGRRVLYYGRTAETHTEYFI